jgi:hypothetical protein
MTAGGGLLQLVATGKQDAFLTGNPQITFFRMVYRRHANYAIESQSMFFDGSANFGQRVTCLIPRRGDLLGRVYLDITLPPIKDSTGRVLSYTNSVGHAIIQEVTLEIGEQEIDKQTGEWMEIWTQFTTPTSQRDALDQLIGRQPQYDNINIIPGPCGLQLLIPLQFFFCNNPGLYLPLIALQYSPIRINIKLRPLNQLFWIQPPAGNQSQWNPALNTAVDCTSPVVNMNLWGDYVYLDVEERRLFVSKSHEYVIEQVQYTPPYAISANQTSATIPVDFNHPLKEFMFVIRRDEMVNRNEWFNYSSLAIGESNLSAPGISIIGPDASAIATGSSTVPNSSTNAQISGYNSLRTDLLATATLQLDGYDRFTLRTAPYFRIQQPYDHHTTTPVNAYIYNYSFALRPEDIQPTGSMNASRIDSIIWQLQLNNALLMPTTVPGYTTRYPARGSCHIIVYAHNYNVFRVINGFGGLLFTI